MRLAGSQRHSAGNLKWRSHPQLALGIVGESLVLMRVSMTCWGSKMERKYLKLSGDYQGEGTHTMLEISNVTQTYSAGDLPKWKYLRLFGDAKEKYP